MSQQSSPKFMLSSIPSGRLSSNSCLTTVSTSRLSSGSDDKHSAGVDAVEETMLYVCTPILEFSKGVEQMNPGFFRSSSHTKDQRKSIATGKDSRRSPDSGLTDQISSITTTHVCLERHALVIGSWLISTRTARYGEANPSPPGSWCCGSVAYSKRAVRGKATNSLGAISLQEALKDCFCAIDGLIRFCRCTLCHWAVPESRPLDDGLHNYWAELP